MKLQKRIGGLDEEIISTVRKQSVTGNKGRLELEAAKKNIKDLFEKIEDIKEKAIKSEATVTEICRDIKQLDYTKKHLATSIATLRRLLSLMNGTEQLAIMVKEKHYQLTEDLLRAVGGLLEGFAAYRNVPKIREIESEVQRIKSELESQIYKDFSNFEGDEPDEVRDKMAEACGVIDALGEAKQKEFVRWFCDLQLREYKAKFSANAPESRLDKVEERFSWLNAQIPMLELEYAGIFPPRWAMSAELAQEFCVITRLALAKTLEKEKEKVDVKALLHALEKTIDFERKLTEKFEGPVDPLPTDEDDEPAADSGTIAARARARVRRYLQNRPQAADEKPKTKHRFKNIISAAFDPYFDLYIEQEDKCVVVLRFASCSVMQESWRVGWKFSFQRNLGCRSNGRQSRAWEQHRHDLHLQEIDATMPSAHHRPSVLRFAFALQKVFAQLFRGAQQASAKVFRLHTRACARACV